MMNREGVGGFHSIHIRGNPCCDSAVQELRWNPVLREWVAAATHRQGRPQMPRDWCPFCPGSGRVPDDYDVYLYPNDFPAFSLDAEQPEPPDSALYRKAPAVGACDVVLYHPDHTTLLERLPVEHLEKVVALWKRRFLELRADSRVRYVLIFENRGEVIGVTMPHPHGQIYALGFIPPRVERELESARLHRQGTGHCLFCDILEEERRDGRRMVDENEHWAAFIPFFARWPYEVHVLARRHLRTIDQLGEAAERSLAALLKRLLLRYDHLFGFPLPLMMLIHQSPVNGDPKAEDLHFHLEFYPPHRSATKLKYLASVEQGSGTFLNDTSAEEKAAELRQASPEP